MPVWVGLAMALGLASGGPAPQDSQEQGGGPVVVAAAPSARGPSPQATSSPLACAASLARRLDAPALRAQALLRVAEGWLDLAQGLLQGRPFPAPSAPQPRVNWPVEGALGDGAWAVHLAHLARGEGQAAALWRQGALAWSPEQAQFQPLDQVARLLRRLPPHVQAQALQGVQPLERLSERELEALAQGCDEAQAEAWVAHGRQAVRALARLGPEAPGSGEGHWDAPADRALRLVRWASFLAALRDEPGAQVAIEAAQVVLARRPEAPGQEATSLEASAWNQAKVAALVWRLAHGPQDGALAQALAFGRALAQSVRLVPAPWGGDARAGELATLAGAVADAGAAAEALAWAAPLPLRERVPLLVACHTRGWPHDQGAGAQAKAQAALRDLIARP